MNAEAARTNRTDHERRQAAIADAMLPLVRAKMIADLDLKIAERSLGGSLDARSESFPSGASLELRACADVLGHYADLGYQAERKTGDNRWHIEISWRQYAREASRQTPATTDQVGPSAGQVEGGGGIEP